MNEGGRAGCFSFLKEGYKNKEELQKMVAFMFVVMVVESTY